MRRDYMACTCHDSARTTCSRSTEKTMPSVDRKHVARPRRRPLDSSLAVAAVGALSATLTLAFTTPTAVPRHHHHHDPCQHSSGGPRSSDRLRPQRQRQHHACRVSRGEPLSSPGSELPAAVLGVGGGRRRGRVRQRESASFGNKVDRTVVADALRWAVAASGSSRPEWYLCCSGAGETTAVADEEEVRLEEEQEDGESTTRAFRHRDDALQRHSRRRQEHGAAAAEAEGEEDGGVKRKRRRPPAYWSNDDNIRNEVVQFWADLGVASDKVR